MLRKVEPDLVDNRNFVSNSGKSSSVIKGALNGLPRSRQPEKIEIAPKVKPRVPKPEDNPNFIFCFKCQRHHHKDVHGSNSLLTAIKSETTSSLGITRPNPIIPAQRIRSYSPYPQNPKQHSTLPLKKRPLKNGQSQIRRKANQYVHYDDEREDEDDELADFIDDSNLNPNLRNRMKMVYRDEEYSEDDLSDMEAGFDEIEHEEKISKYIGMKEDQQEEMINKKFSSKLI
jgi:hypothetical protein